MSGKSFFAKRQFAGKQNFYFYFYFFLYTYIQYNTCFLLPSWIASSQASTDSCSGARVALVRQTLRVVAGAIVGVAGGATWVVSHVEMGFSHAIIAQERGPMMYPRQALVGPCILAGVSLARVATGRGVGVADCPCSRGTTVLCYWSELERPDVNADRETRLNFQKQV
jgi:hypothetical protein